MPWKARSGMEEKVRFVFEYEQDEHTMTELSQLRHRGPEEELRKTTAEEGLRGCYAFALAFSLTPPSASSTEYSTLSQPYCLRICSVFFCTKVVKESKLPEIFSPAFFLAATRVLYKRSTCSRSALSTLRRVNGWDDAASAAVAAAAAAAA